MSMLDNPSALIEEIEDAEDNALLKRWVEYKSREAFDELHDRHYANICAFISRVIGNRTEAEDIWQEVILRVFTHPPSQDKITDFRFRPWLFRITHNVIADYWRKNNSTVARILHVSPDILAEVAPSTDDVEREVSTRLAWHTAIGLLSPAQRDIIVLRYMEGRDPTEIAGILNLNRNAVGVRLFRARQRLIAHLKTLGIDL